MTIRLPPRGQRSGPIYQAIADQIGREIEAGRMKPGSRLPTQRSLARQLGVTLTTVTRAYEEAQRRGLLNGEVGRGTFVRPTAFEIEGPEHGLLDLAVNSLLPLPYTEELADRLAAAIPPAGGQHAILLSLMSVANPGDEILVEEFTYPGISDLAEHLHLRLQSVALDK